MGKKKEVTVGETDKKIKRVKKEKKVAKKEQTSDVIQVAVEKTKSVKAPKRGRGKKYLSLRQKTDKKTVYLLKEALKLIKESAFETFDSSVEVHANLMEKGLKGEVNFPHGTGKTVTIVVFDDNVEEQIKTNKIDFDILLAMPKDMAKLVKYAKVLGPKGLMPSPKRGTLTDDIVGAKKKLGSGTINYKAEAKFPILHQIVGKRSFTEIQLEENVLALIAAVTRKNITELFIKSSMSPALKIDISAL